MGLRADVVSFTASSRVQGFLTSRLPVAVTALPEGVFRVGEEQARHVDWSSSG